jgi:hypothetical protein
VKPFDHSKTRFALVAAPKEVACAKCDAGGRYQSLATICSSGHGWQDKHAGCNGSNCETCHAPTKWAAVSFDYNKVTRFPLRGGHAKLACDRCHTSEARRHRLATNRAACQRKDHPHKGQLGAACESCHREAGGRQAVAFDLDLTRFARIGLHAAVPCEACHRTPSCKDASRVCASCQEDHTGRLGPNCATCRNPNGWPQWRFDHDKQTPYPLTGAPRALQCHACHATSTVATVSAPGTCHPCHGQDDVHDGGFGRACEKCHTTVSFRQGLARQ